MQRRIPLLFGFFLVSTALSFASITEEGFGIIHGSDHAFSLKAPKGWMLDNESGVDQGVHAVFYPKGSNWQDSVVVAYARARPITPTVKTAADAAKLVIEDFHANGSPKYTGKHVKTIKTTSGRDAVIYHFSGDQWGNSEAAVYYVEAKTINHIVLTSRDPKAFTAALPALDELAASYIYVGDSVDHSKSASDKTFDQVLKEAKELGETEAGKTYEKAFGATFAKPMQAALKTCSKETTPPYSLNLVFIIAADGATERILAVPGQPVSVCVAEKLQGLKLPAPPKPGWLVAVKFTIKN